MTFGPSGAASADRIGDRAAAALRSVGAVWFAVAGLYIVSGLVSPAMFQVGQVLNILQVAAFLGLVAAGQTVALLVGGIDLSVAGVVTLTNILANSLMDGDPANMAPAIAACLAVAALAGIANGVLVACLRVTPLIATLGMGSILYGAALVYTGGAPRGAVAPGFGVAGQGSVAGLPVSTLVWLAVSVAAAWMLRRTVFGRWLYAVGANPAAARLMGVPVRGVLVAAYALSAVLASLGGLLLTSYIGAPSLGIGNQFLLSSVAAVVVGGTALTGGVGGVIATVGGTLFITELNSFTNIVRVSTGTQYVLQGAIIALSVLLYRFVDRRDRAPAPAPLDTRPRAAA